MFCTVSLVGLCVISFKNGHRLPPPPSFFIFSKVGVQVKILDAPPFVLSVPFTLLPPSIVLSTPSSAIFQLVSEASAAFKLKKHLNNCNSRLRMCWVTCKGNASSQHAND